MDSLFGIFLIISILPVICTQTGRQCNRQEKRCLTAEERLIKDLFADYDTDARSVVNTTKTVIVTIQFLLLRIQRLDERSQVLMTTGLLLTDWTDERLEWNQQQYNNITDIVVRAERIWTPELAVINGADDMIQEFEKIRVLIKSNGQVHWEPGGVFTTTCDIDITYFPFDTQACEIEIGAWAYTCSRMNLSNSNFTMETGEFKLNGEWDIYATRARWKEVILPAGSEISYSKVVFTIHMHRRFAFYVVNIILPCALLSTLILIVFCVPPDAGEKISAGISVLLAFTVFLLMLADNVPRTSLDVPILVIYLAITMALGTASVCLTVVVLNFHHRGSTRPVPEWARSLLLQKCARLLFLPEVYRATRLHNLQERNKRTVCRTDCGHGRCRNTEHNSLMYNTNEDRMAKEMSAHSERPRTLQVSESKLMAETILNETLQYHNIDKSNLARKPSIPPKNNTFKKQEEMLTKEWQLVARVVDRIFFCVIFLIMFSSASLILLSPWYAKTYSLPLQDE